MIDSNSVGVGSGDMMSPPAADSSLTAPFPVVRPFASTLEHSRILGLTLIVTLAVAVRTFGLGASGFSEDEINKLHAVRAYDRLDFSDNAEHPMLMKLAVWTSMSAARWWNRHPPLAALVVVSPEAALRLPNALVGAATTLVVFLLAEMLFDAPVGAWAAIFWALDGNAAAINRIGKEDTFLLFFLLLAAYLYERGKALTLRDPVRRERWFAASGASFGLMVASKYMPHFFGLHTLFNVAADRSPTEGAPDKRLSFYAAMGGAFLAANFALLGPSTWRYLAGYVRGDTLRHSGYVFAHHIYVNAVYPTPWGVPPTFYLTFFFTKAPLIVLGLAALGFVWVARHPRDRGATFLRVFFVFTLLPYSFVESKFLRYMLPVLLIIDITAAVGLAWILGRLDRLVAPRREGGRDIYARELAAAAVVALAIVPQVAQDVSAAPFYGLAQNWIGARLGPPGGLFPDDEFYDAGVREATEAIARAAAPGAIVCSDATAVVSEYLERYGRRDMRSCSMAHDGLPMARVETWVIVQDGHIYFENEGIVEQLRAKRPWMRVRVGGATAAQVFRFR